MDDNKKLLGLMRFWLFGTFIIVFAATLVYAGLFVDVMNAIKAVWQIWLVTAILCVAWYFAYQWYLGRKK